MLLESRKAGWLVALLWAAPAWSATYTAKVRWQPNTDARVIGYHVYMRLLTGVYGTPQDAKVPTPAADGTMSYLVTGLDSSVGYAFAVTDYANGGLESSMSNEVTVPVRPTTTTTNTTSTTARSTSTTTRGATTTIARATTTSTTTTTTRHGATTTTTSTTLPGASLCSSTPRSGCQAAAAKKAPFLLGRGQLKWRWIGAAPVDVSDFGNPGATTDYLMCVYDASGRKLSALAPGGGICRVHPCWRAFSSLGFRYGDKDGLPDGLTQILLLAGSAGRARIQVAGRTANLPSPAMPLTTPVRVQFQRRDTSACWEARYGTASSNSANGFKAKSD